MKLTGEEYDLLELCIQSQVAQLAYSCKMAGVDSSILVGAVGKLESVAEKLRQGRREDGER